MPPVLRIMLVQKGCVNRPFYHIAATYLKRRPDQPTLEQIGSFDPMPNENNENLVSINYDRLNYWFGQGASPARGFGMLLGMAGYTVIHPYSYKRAWQARRKQAAKKPSPPTTEDPAGGPPESTNIGGPEEAKAAVSASN